MELYVVACKWFLLHRLYLLDGCRYGRCGRRILFVRSFVCLFFSLLSLSYDQQLNGIVTILRSPPAHQSASVVRRRLRV